MRAFVVFDLPAGCRPVAAGAARSGVCLPAALGGVTPSRLIEAGRADAAEILREIQIQKAGKAASLPDPLDNLDAQRQRIILDMLQQLPPADRGPALRRLAERVEAGELDRESDASPTEPGARPVEQRSTGS
ncbi:hypothetical protein ACWGQ5_22505 [Streptomyces sp. NPDC055722]